MIRATFVAHTAAPSGAELATLRLLSAVRNSSTGLILEPSVVYTEDGPMVNNWKVTPTTVCHSWSTARRALPGPTRQRRKPHNSYHRIRGHIPATEVLPPRQQVVRQLVGQQRGENDGHQIGRRRPSSMQVEQPAWTLFYPLLNFVINDALDNHKCTSPVRSYR
ncbi:Probable glycosyl transferase [Mycobacteroides abscessus]|nr:Probable glycosyl transferase [Mycobacteroides abscessus]